MPNAFAKTLPTGADNKAAASAVELLCPASNLVGLRMAVDNGANGVLLDYRHGESIAGTGAAMTKGLRYAHERGCKVALGLDLRPQPTSWALLRATIDRAAESGVDALVLSDPALMLYAAGRHPQLPLHYAAPVSALHPESVNYFQRQLGISRIVLPRVVSLFQIRQIAEHSNIEIEVAGFGPACAITGGRIPGLTGTRLADIDVNAPGHHREFLAHLLNKECSAGADDATNDHYYAANGLPDTNALQLLPQLTAMGVRAIRVEANDGVAGHLAQAARVWREAIDCCGKDLDHYSVKQSWIAELKRLARLHPIGLN